MRFDSIWSFDRSRKKESWHVSRRTRSMPTSAKTFKTFCIIWQLNHALSIISLTAMKTRLDYANHSPRFCRRRHIPKKADVGIFLKGIFSPLAKQWIWIFCGGEDLDGEIGGVGIVPEVQAEIVVGAYQQLLASLDERREDIHRVGTSLTITV